MISYIRITSIVYFLFFLAFYCKPPSNELDSFILPPVAAPQDYCLSLDSIAVPDIKNPPKLYGWICASSSEDSSLLSIASIAQNDPNGIQASTLTAAQVRSFLVNCKNYFFERDATPAANQLLNLDTLIQVASIFVPDVAKNLPSDEIFALLRSPPNNFTTTLEHSTIMGTSVQSITATGYNLNIKRTFTLKDRFNHKIILIVLPILGSLDTGASSSLAGLLSATDDIYYPYDGLDTNKGMIPGLKLFGSSDFQRNPFLKISSPIRISTKSSLGGVIPGLGSSYVLDSNSSPGTAGQATFNFSIQQGRCATEYSGPLDRYPDYQGVINSSSLSATPDARFLNGGSGTLESLIVNSINASATCVKVTSLAVKGGDWSVFGMNVNGALSGALCAFSSDNTETWNTVSAFSALYNCTQNPSRNNNTLWIKKGHSDPFSSLDSNVFSLANLVPELDFSYVYSVIKDEFLNYSALGTTSPLTVGTSTIYYANTTDKGAGIFNRGVSIPLLKNTSKAQLAFLPMTSYLSGAAKTLTRGPGFDSSTNSNFPWLVSFRRDAITGLANQTLIKSATLGSPRSAGGQLEFNFSASWGACTP